MICAIVVLSSEPPCFGPNESKIAVPSPASQPVVWLLFMNEISSSQNKFGML